MQTHTQEIETTIHIPVDKVKTTKLNEQICQSLKDSEEGYCGKYGYVIPQTIRLLSRSLPKIVSIDTRSFLEYIVRYAVDTIYPCKGDIFECKIESETKMGLMGYLDYKIHEDEPCLKNSPILFVIPQQMLDDVDESLRKPGTSLKVEILQRRIKYRSKQIQAVSKISV
tara:strand:- start:98 stop:604 length:507 start_codon:yes stop_codon:yes gene_type:complete